ncbi:MAG: hypothetical protein M3Z05_02095 [Gemmatimonadota bacterium]|nr:hypothetical protein [Gemmatimonadota bacterium]
MQRLHHRLQRRQLGELFDLAIQLFAALQLVHQQGVILAVDDAILGGERRRVRRQVLQPLEMRRAPVRPLTKDEAARRQELQDVVPRLQNPPREGLAPIGSTAIVIESLCTSIPR